MKTFMDCVIEDSAPIWDRCAAHPFIREFASGALSRERFLRYIVQDSIYLREYAKVFALAIYKSKTMADIREYYSLLGFVRENESMVRVKCLGAAGMTEEDADRSPVYPQNAAYTGFMLSCAEKGGEREILMATLPCMLSYRYIFEKVDINDCSDPLYREVLKDYASDSYKSCCERWTAFAETKCADADTEERKRLVGIFRRSSEYELDFWNMSYGGGDEA